MFAGFVALAALPAAAQDRPRLEVTRLAGPEVELRWPEAAGNWQLEASPAVGPGAAWQALAAPPPAAGSFTVRLSAMATARFFRLRQTAPAGPARLMETSPAAGEAGVSVTRETILRLDQPLDPGALLSTNNLFAEAAGRRLLTRATLSDDRRVLTLFPLEPMPGGARVRVTLRGDTLGDADGRLVDADGDGRPGGTGTLEFHTFSQALVPGTAIMGRVFASEVVAGTGTGTNAVNRPLAGVTITVDGAEQSLRTTTDANGSFTVDPCPAGRFFVHVDGRTATGSQWPGGAYYPFVGKAWEALAGVTTNLAGGTGEIFLPLITAGTLQPVSAGKDTRVTFPASVTAGNAALAGVELLVPANALVDDAGARGGRVGLAPVPPDRLPEPLPPGLELPLVITIQTDGAQNFDRPAPIRFPNLPDAVTGERLPPGAKSALWSFNHDTGRWEMQGPMTVTADGLFVDCDPGVGIRQPGWHGTRPGNEVRPPPPIKPDRDKKKEKDCDEDDLFTATAIEALLYSIADGMEIIAGSDNYAGDHLRHFMDGDGAPINDGPDSPRGQDLKDSNAYANELNNTRSDLESRIRREAANDPNANTLGDFEHETTGLSFYGESGLPGGELQLGYTFGEVSRGNVDVNLSAVSFERVPGGIEYRANLSFSVHEKYEFNANDRSQGEFLSFPGLAKCLQDAGFATPFDTRVTTTDTLTGFIPDRPAPQAEPVPGRGRPSLHDPAPDAPTFALEIPVPVTTEFRGGGLSLVLQPDGRYGFADLEPPAPQRCLYAVEDLATGEITRRGVTGEAGTAFTGLIMASDRRFRLHLLNVATLEVADAILVTPTAGLPVRLPPFIFGDDSTNDLDADELGPLGERIAGTDPAKADTDGDGVRDGAEVRAGLPATGAQAVLTGVIATAPTPGLADDVAVWGDVAVVVTVQPSTVALFNIFGGLAPTLMAVVPLPGNPGRLAADEGWAVVPLGASGAMLLDLANPAQPAPRIVSRPGAVYTAAAVGGGLVFLGGAGGTSLTTVEPRTGAVLDEIAVLPAGEVQDLAFADGLLYALQFQTLSAVILPGGVPLLSRTVDSPGELGAGRRPLRLAAGDGFLVATHTLGFNVFSLTNPPLPSLVRTNPTSQAGWKRAVPAGNGLLAAAADPNSTPDGAHDVQTYNLPDLAGPPTLRDVLPTPGYAATLALANGLAYVADGEAGLQVMNYLPLDDRGVAPTIQLWAAPAGPAVEGEPLELAARVSDDVQVARVEFWQDGVRIANDSTYPFRHRLLAPPAALATNGLRLRARAFDTGGNSAWSDELTLPVQPAAAGLAVRQLVPPPESSVALLRSVSVIFNSPLDPAGYDAGSLRLFAPGADDQFGTADDAAVAGGRLSEAAGGTRLILGFPDDLAVGRFQARLAGGLRNAAGAALAAGTNWLFRVTAASPPEVLRTVPPVNARVSDLPRLEVFFSEPLDRASLGATPLALFTAGPDGQLDTADDLAVAGLTLLADTTDEVIAVRPGLGVTNGPCRVRLSDAIRDRSGIALGAQFSWTFTLRDTNSPIAVQREPRGPELVTGDVPLLVATFSEALLPATVTPAAVELTERGADGLFGTGDDRFIPVAEAAYDPASAQVRLRPAAPLVPGHYQVRFRDAVRDPAGNPVSNGAGWFFSVAVETEILGLAVRGDGSPLAGATLFVTGVDGAETTGPDGRFRVRGARLPAGGAVEARVRLIEAGIELLAATNGVPPVHRGLTDVGRLVASELCAARFAEDLFPRPGLTEGVNALIVFDDGTGPKVYAALASSLATREGAVVRWTGDDWEPVGGAFAGTLFRLGVVHALAVYDDGTGPALYAGGWFDLAGGVAATNIARWTGAAWAPLGPGLSTSRSVVPDVRALAVFDDGTGPSLYAGGGFNRAGTNVVPGIARWNGSAWSEVGGGLRSEPFGVLDVNALAVFNDGSGPRLAVGGIFATAGSQPAANLAAWNGAAWSDLGGGVTNPPSGSVAVYALAARSEGGRDALYVGGRFSQAGVTPVSGLARWDGAAWSNVGGGVSGGSFGQSGGVFALGSFADELIVAGDFGTAGTAGAVQASSIARWNGTRWAALDVPSDFSVGLGGQGRALTALGGELFAGGTFDGMFTATGRVPGQNVARWNGASWRPAGRGLDSPVRALASTRLGGQPALVVAGGFAWADSRPAYAVARWDGRRFHPLGGGLVQTPFGDPFPGDVRALLELPEINGPVLIAAGRFDQAGGGATTNIARWDGQAWSPLGPGLVDSFGGGQVDALARLDTPAGLRLVAGGRFDRAGATATVGVAAWDGNAWSPLGHGLRGEVHALAVFDSGAGPELIAGGNLSAASPADGFLGSVARWDGTRWRPLGPGSFLNGRVNALLVYDDGRGPRLYAGGGFDRTATGPLASPGIARWNGEAWEPVGAGPGDGFNEVLTLAAFDDGAGRALYAGGNFRLFGPGGYNGLARWDGFAWAGLSAQYSGTAQALAVHDDGTGPALFAGGAVQAGGFGTNRLVSVNLVKWFRPAGPCGP